MLQDSAPLREHMSFESKSLLGSSTSVVACTRGGRPGGSIMGNTGVEFEVSVTGTTVTGARGGSIAAAMGTSGLTSGGNVSDGLSLKMGAESGGERTTEERSTESCGGVFRSATGSARPFKVLGSGVGEGVRVRGGSETDLSVFWVCLCSVTEGEGEAESRSQLLEAGSATVDSGAGKGRSGCTAECSGTGASASSLSTEAAGETCTGEEDF